MVLCSTSLSLWRGAVDNAVLEVFCFLFGCSLLLFWVFFPSFEKQHIKRSRCQCSLGLMVAVHMSHLATTIITGLATHGGTVLTAQYKLKIVFFSILCMCGCHFCLSQSRLVDSKAELRWCYCCDGQAGWWNKISSMAINFSVSLWMLLPFYLCHTHLRTNPLQ